MSYLTLTSYNSNTDNNTDFVVSNTTTNFKCNFKEPILVKPFSYVKLNFVSCFLINDNIKRPIFITSPTFSQANSRMTGIGNNGLLGVVRLDDEFGAVGVGAEHTFTTRDSFPYIALNNANEMRLSEIEIKIVNESGNVYDNIKGYTNSGVGQDTQTQTIIGIQIIDSQFKDIV